MSIDKKKITDLIEENYVYASVLFYFGIEFYEYSEKTLEEVCQEKGMNVAALTKALEQVNQIGEEHDLMLISYPIDLIIEYLRHSHYLFIKRQLPFLASLINTLETDHQKYCQIVKDLKLIFPVFVEDFIHHVYEEEDTLFSYIMVLKNATKKNYHHGELHYILEKNTIQKFAVEHEIHDDEMVGIRQMLNNYESDSSTPQNISVLFSALQKFEHDLIVHAKVENEVLFPKALMLEKEVKKLMRNKIVLN